MYEMSGNPDLKSLPAGRVFLMGLILAVVTLAAYWPVLRCGFVNYDDNTYVTENRHVLKGISPEGIRWAFLSVGYVSNWHPLTWLSHMLDCQLFGQHAGLHHLTNLLIHTASVMLLFWVLVSMTGRLGPSAFVAAVFAIHPLHVESVAWIAERKDVLSGFFWVLTMACYLCYTRTHSRGSYLLTLFCFGLGLLAKPMLVTLPFVLLLLDFWPLNRLERRSAGARIAEKIPFLILSAASCVITVIAQRAGGAVWDMQTLPFGARLSNAAVSYMAYIVKTVWPVRLAVLYPLRPIPPWQFISALTGLMIVTATALLLIRRKRYLAVGWLWYVGTLIPVIGLVQVGVQRLADRYMYIPLIGLGLIAAWAVSDICRKRPALRPVSGVTAILLLAAMFVGTRSQIRYWRDSISLCRRAIQVTENNYIMHNNLGNALRENNQSEEAIFHYRRALQINPDHANAYINLGNMFIEAGQREEAIAQYRRALQIDPDHADAHYDLGNALLEAGRWDEAIVHYRRALQIHPDHAETHNNLGLALSKTGQWDEAITQYRRALQIDPDHAEAHSNLGTALKQMDRLEEAIVQYRRVLQTDPKDVKVYNDLGNALLDAGRWEEAIVHYRRLIELQPEYPAGLNNLAWILATASDPSLRNPVEAVQFAQKACELTDYQDPSMMDTLAAAYAAAGRFEEAVSTIEKALRLAEGTEYENLAARLNEHLKLFQEGRTDVGQ